MENNLTKEENIILNLLLAKRGTVPEIELSDKKETVKEMQQRVYNNHIKNKALREIRKLKGKR
jgi:hypothetical protein